MPKRLNNEQIKQLRGNCHALRPVVMIAADGLTDNVSAAIESALLSHELIKIRIRDERKQREQISDRILALTGAEKIMSIGQVFCIYRRHPDHPRLLA